MQPERELVERLVKVGNRLESYGRIVRKCADGCEREPGSTARYLEELEPLLEEAVTEIRAAGDELELIAASAAAVPVAPTPAPRPSPASAARVRPAPVRPASPAAPPAPTLRERAEAAGVLGARGLALAGGVVTILGVVFLFVLAANRGWIGPQARLALGACVSATAVGAGFWIRSRFGLFQAALGSVGAGIAGGYATLLAAGALYDFVPLWAGLLIAAAIAAVGAAIAISWHSETVAALGLVGAIAVPGLASIGLGLSVAGTAFVAVVLAATLLLAIRERWDRLLLAAVAASLPQLLVLVGWPLSGESGKIMVLAAVFSGIYLAAGLLLQRRANAPRIDPLASAFVSGPAALAAWSAFRLVDGSLLGIDRAGAVVLGISVVYGILCGIAFTRHRELSVLLGALAAVVGAIAVAQLTGGATLAIVWAIEGAAFAWLAIRLGEARFQLAALGYLGLALVHVLAFEAPPRLLYVSSAHPAGGFVALLVVAAGFVAFGLAARRWPGTRDEDRKGWLGPLVEELRRGLDVVREAAYSAGAVLTLYAVSLGILWMAQRALDGSTLARFQWGHVAAAGLWAAIGCGLIGLGDGERRRVPWLAGLILVSATLLDFLLFEHKYLPSTNWSVAALTLAGAMLVGGLIDGLRGRYDPTVPAAAGLLGSLGLATGAAVELVGGTVASIDAQGLTLLLGGAFYALLALAVLWLSKRRNLGTLLWVEGLGLGLAAAPQLVLHTGLVAALALAAVALAALGRAAHEPRLQLGALAPLAGAIGYTLAALATPRQLYVELLSPGDGVVAVILTAAAVAAIGLLVPAGRKATDRLDLALDTITPDFRTLTAWIAGVLTLHAASLGILQLAQWIDAGTTLSNYQWGRVTVTALWATVAVLLVVLGRGGDRPAFRMVGLGLLALALVDFVGLEAATFPGTAWAVAATMLAAACVTSGIADSLRGRSDPGLPALATLPVSAALVGAATAEAFGGRTEGAVLLTAAAAYIVLAVGAAFVPRRNVETLLWVEGLALALAAAPLLVLHTGLVAALTIGTTAIALIAHRAQEPRLQLAATAPLLGAFGYTLAVLATPRQLFAETAAPGDGVGALLLCAGAVLVLFALARPLAPAAPDRLDAEVSRLLPRFRTGAGWAAAVLALDAASLGVLQLTNWGNGTFQTGQMFVSMLWGLVALAALTTGLIAGWATERLAGFLLFGLTLAKIFLYDLSSLSSVARALSFLAVGSVLLAAGFFYQRLTGESHHDRRHRRGGPPAAPAVG